MHQHASPTPYSPALVETLQTVIAPGERARLSPLRERTAFGDIISEGMRSIDKITFLWYNLFQKETKFRAERVVRLAKGSIRRVACAPCW